MMKGRKFFVSYPVSFYLSAILFYFGTFSCRTESQSTRKDWPSDLDTLMMGSDIIDQDSTRIYLPTDLQANLWAQSPMLYNPTNMDIDYKGRIWVTEAVNYRDFNPHSPNRKHFAKGDRVVILEDTNDDGVADTSKVFVQDTDLVAPLGIAVIGNKVIVSCSPNLIQYTDENGDDIPDKKEIILKGFGGLDHDHSLHSVIAGPDGNWYFNTGNAGPHIVKDKSGWTLRSGSMYTGGTPYNQSNQGNMVSDDGRIWVGGLALRINKNVNQLKVMAHNFRNSYEVMIDSYGNLWQNDNDDQVMACRTSYVMEGGNAGYFSEDGTRSWQADRRPWQDIFTAHWHQDDPGVMPVSDNAGAGSPTGVAINESDALGKVYRGMILSAEAGRNAIYAYWPQPDGAGYSMKRHVLISSLPKDNINYQWNQDIVDKRMWFRPSDVCFGTDGAMYIADWYDPIVGGHAMHDTLGYGRILRISPRGVKLTKPDININTEEGILKAIQSPAINVRNLGFEKIVSETGKYQNVVTKLIHSSDSYTKARGIWILAKTDPTALVSFLHDGNENMQVTAFRAMKASGGLTIPWMDTILVNASKPMLREIAIAVRDIPFKNCKSILKKLIDRYDDSDQWMNAAISIACDKKENDVYENILSGNINKKSRIGLLFTLHPAKAVREISGLIQSNETTPIEKTKLITALSFIDDSLAISEMIKISFSKDSASRSQAFWWVNFKRLYGWALIYDWKKYDQENQRPHHKELLAFLNTFVHSKNIKIKTEAAVKLAIDPDGGKLLIPILSNGNIDRTLSDTIARILFTNPDPRIRAVAGDLFWKKSDKSYHQYSPELISKMDADTSNGRKLFSTKCMLCHAFRGKGADIGPDLTFVVNKLDKLSLIDAVLNPSSSIAFGYELKTIQTRDHKTYKGFILSDGSITSMKDMTGHLSQIPKSSILSIKSNPQSLMLAANQLGLSDREVADVIGYLRK